MNDNIRRIVDKSKWLLINDLRKQLELAIRDCPVSSQHPDFKPILDTLSDLTVDKLSKKAEWPID